MPVTMHPDCDEVLTFAGASAGGGYLNSATVTYAIYDSGGTLATGTMSYTAASNGDYTATIESTVTTLLTPGGYYYAILTLASGSYNDRRRVRIHVEYRAET